MVKKLKDLEARRQELLPDVEEEARISVDSEDIEFHPSPQSRGG